MDSRSSSSSSTVRLLFDAESAAADDSVDSVQPQSQLESALVDQATLTDIELPTATAATDASDASDSVTTSSSSVVSDFSPVLHFLCFQGVALGMGLVLFPALFLDIFSGDSSSSAAASGVSASVAAGLQCFTNPIAGQWSNQIGRKPFLLLSAAVWLSITAVLAASPSLPAICVATLLRGLDCGVTISATVATDLFPAAQLVAANGRVAGFLALGMLFGPLLAALFSLLDPFRVPFSVCAALLILNVWMLRRKFVESAHQTQSQDSLRECKLPAGQWRFFDSFRILCLTRSILCLSLASFLSLFNLSGLSSVFYLFLHEKHGWGPTENGIFLFLFALAAILAQAFLLPQLSKPNSALQRLGFTEKRLVALALTTGAVQLIALAIVPSSASLILFFIPFVVFPSFVLSSILRGAVSRLCPQQQQGAMQGGLGSINALAGILGPLAFSSAFSAAVRSDSAIYLPEIPFFIALAGLAAITILLAAAYQQTEPSAYEQLDRRSEAVEIELTDPVQASNPNSSSTSLSEQPIA